MHLLIDGSVEGQYITIVAVFDYDGQNPTSEMTSEKIVNVCVPSMVRIEKFSNCSYNIGILETI